MAMNIKDQKTVWIAVMGPDTGPLGERSDVALVTQAQIAATISELLGLDYRSAVPKSAPPITEVTGDKATK